MIINQVNQRLNVQQAFFSSLLLFLLFISHIYVLLNRLHCENTSVSHLFFRFFSFLFCFLDHFQGRWQIFETKGLLAGVN